MDISLTISGLAELEKALMDLDKRIRKKVVKRAVRMGANVIKAEVKALAAANVGGEMGRLLARNIQVAPHKKQRPGQYGMTARIRAGIPEFMHTTEGGERQYIPHAIEYGHQGPSGKLVAPIPFMLPAVQSKRQKAENVMIRELINGVELNQ